MFRRDLHRAMMKVLDALDAGVLAQSRCYFAGGTRISLAHDEFRVSRDLDFVCSDATGFADLRQAVRERGYDGLFAADRPADIATPREVRSDQYGMRFPVVIGALTIRVELIREARITLGSADSAPWTRLALLSIPDLFAEKLLANSDRGADAGELSRDLVDLAVLREAHGPIPAAAWSAAEAAYRTAPRADLRTAGERFLADSTFQERSFTGLQVDNRERVLRGVRLLLRD